MAEPSEAAVRVKICGITRLADGLNAARAGADYLGVVSSSGFARSAPPELAMGLGEETASQVVAVTVNEPVEELLRIARETSCAILQLHGDEPPRLLEQLRDEGPWKLWKALRVRTGEELRTGLERYAPVADGILVDGWHPEHRGGSGARFPWDLVASNREAFPSGVEFIAAGGLTPANVAEAVRSLDPDVVDVSSGVEMEKGLKDGGRVRSFIENAKRARQ